MKQDNRIILDLSKCQWARFYYQNQHGDKRNTRPVYHTVFNCGVPVSDKVFGSSLLMIDHAKKHNLIDVWTPCVVFKLTAHETLKYTGEKAVSLYKSWCDKIFNKKGKK